MVPRTDADAEPERPRAPLSRDRVLRTAVALADAEGLGALTMRRLGQELGAEAMSLYHHVAGKEAVLDGVVEVVAAEILDVASEVEAPDPAEDWRGALRARILAARTVLLRHPWAPAVIETRTSLSVGVVTWYDQLLGIMRAGGMSYDLAHHAMHALGSRALGFTHELFEPDDPEVGDEEAAAMLEEMAGRLPHLVEMMGEIAHGDEGQLGWCDDQFEFEFGLDLLLDGLERRRAAEG
ncbi:TetR/AcrR family transcriptional regulator C-terminal domain-containing protein [Euzebya sp.]|uniref:TetR/AcrR family transcriptional regulator C-terminal domain-containing protein n=1 Tax=Euzebya sp. TaxID=1971409 RepID=UPI003519D1D4